MSDLDMLRKQLAFQNEQVDTFVTQLGEAATPETQKSIRDQMAAAQTTVHQLEQQIGEAAAKAKAEAEAAAQAEATALEHAVGEAAPATGGMAVGATAYVRQAGGMGLRRRSGPSLSAEVIDAFAPGTALALLAGPTEADGHQWWHVRAEDGREGWVAGEELVLTAE